MTSHVTSAPLPDSFIIVDGQLDITDVSGADVRLTTMSLSISSQGKPQHSTGALDDQQLLAIEGSKKSRQGGHSTSKWTECEKCRKKRRKPPLHRHNRKLSTGTVRTLSMNCKCGTCCTPTGMQQPCPRTGGSQRFSQRSATVGAACLLHNWHLRNLHDLHNKDEDHLVNTCNRGIAMVF